MAEWVAHPDYVATGRYHDIALLRLARPAALSRRGVRPACLHTDLDGDLAGQEAVATGWGATGFGELHRRAYEKALKIISRSLS